MRRNFISLLATLKVKWFTTQIERHILLKIYTHATTLQKAETHCPISRSTEDVSLTGTEMQKKKKKNSDKKEVSVDTRRLLNLIILREVLARVCEK